MAPARRPVPSHRRPGPHLLALLGAVLALACSWALADARPAVAQVHQLSEGELSWGVKESWRNYVGGGVVSEGAELNADGTFKFPLESGTYDDETRTTVLNFGGQVWFRAWWEFTSPGKWALDTTFRDLQVVISPEEQVIRGTHVGYSQDDPGGELHEFYDVVLGSVDVTTGEVSFDGGVSSYSNLRTIAGGGLLLYSPGSLIDPVSFSYAGPGGIPDLGEDFGTPGGVSLVPAARHVSDWTQESWTMANRRAFASADGKGLTFAEIKSSTGAAAQLRITRLDPESLEPLGTPTVISPLPVYNGNRYWGRYFRFAHDAETDDLYFLRGGMGADNFGNWVMRARWNQGAGSFEVEKVAELPPAFVNGQGNLQSPSFGELVYNDVLDELAVLSKNPAPSDLYDGGILYRFQRQDDGGWERVDAVLRAPDGGRWADANILITPWEMAATASLVPRWNNIAVARDGGYVIPSQTARIRQLDPESGEQVETKLPSVHIAIDGDEATPRYIEGTVAETHPAFDYYYGWSAASRSHDGSVLIHNSQWGLETFVRVDVVAGKAQVVGPVYRTFDTSPPYQSSTLGHSVAADPVRGWDWITDRSDPDGFVFNAFHEAGGVDTMFSRHKQPEFIGGVLGSTPEVGPDGDVYLIVKDGDANAAALQRFEYLGIFVELGEQPADVVASLTAEEESEAVSFTSTVVGGTPAPTRRWQLKQPGTTKFADLAGESGETLELDATRELAGAQVRAVYSSAAGEIATEPAELDVRFAPAVVNQPQDVSIVAGQPANFVAMPAGNPMPEIQWQVRIGGVWQAVDLDSGQFEVSGEQGGFLTVTETSTELDGAVFRARLRNRITPGSDAWSTAFTRAAKLAVSAAPSAARTFGSGSFEWGIAERWRCYVTGTVAQGGVEVGGGVTRIPGTEAKGALCPAAGESSLAFSFPVRGGSYDPASGSLEVKMNGSVRFWGHAYHVPGSTTPQLDTTFSDLRLVASGDTGTIYADATGATMGNPSPVTHEDVPLASVDLAGSGPVPDGEAGLTWSAAPTALTASGAEVFDSYPVGEPFDPVAMRLRFGTPQPDPGPGPGPQAKPELPEPIAGVAQVTGPAARVKPAKAKQSLGGSRVARLGALSCPAGAPCRVLAPKRVRVKVAGESFAAQVLAPRWIGAGRDAQLRVRLPRGAAERLATKAARRAMVRVKVRLLANGNTTTRELRVVVRR